MNQHLRKLAEQAARNVDLNYPGDAYPSAIAKEIVRDLTTEFTKIKWAGEDEAWDKAVAAVIKEVSTRYGVKT